MKISKLKNSRFLTIALLTLASVTSVTHTAPIKSAALTPAVIAGMTVAQREAQAIEVLRKFVTCPLSEVELWSTFVDKITALLDGIPEYKAFCESLKSVRKEWIYGVGHTKIKKALMQHVASLKKIPQDIKDIFDKMDWSESMNRVRLK